MSVSRKPLILLAATGMIVGLTLAWSGFLPRWLAGEADSGRMAELLGLSFSGLVSLFLAVAALRRSRPRS